MTTTFMPHPSNLRRRALAWHEYYALHEDDAMRCDFAYFAANVSGLLTALKAENAACVGHLRREATDVFAWHEGLMEPGDAVYPASVLLTVELLLHLPQCPAARRLLTVFADGWHAYRDAWGRKAVGL